MVKGKYTIRRGTANRATNQICTRIFLYFSLKYSRRFASSCYFSVWGESLGNRADGFRRNVVCTPWIMPRRFV
jgi:hypothetical protein